MKNLSKRTQGQGLHQGLIVLFITFILISSCARENQHNNFFQPAEFDEQESTFICWNPTFQQTLLNLTRIIAEEDHVTMFYNERNHQKESLWSLLERHQIKTRNVTLIPFNLQNDNIWIRDYGPTFIEDEKGEHRVLNFQYNHEDNQEYNLFGEQYSSQMQLSFLRSKMFSAGGGREVNGKGTMILIESYEKSLNPDLSLQEIENEYNQHLNIKNFIWLKRGIPQDDAFDNGPVHENIYGNGVNGHIDEFCRFADPNTILLAQVDEADLKRDNYFQVIHERLEESYHILKKARDQDGNPFKIIRIPQAPVLFNDAKYEGKDIYYTPVTSYLNFVITNHSVIVPAYYDPGDPDFIKEKDEAARKKFQETFKSRKVVMAHSLDLNYSGGGLHCITLHKPKILKRSLWRQKFG